MLDFGQVIRDGFDYILYNVIYVLFYYLEVALCRVISWMEELFGVFSGVETVNYNGSDDYYLINVFFENKIINAVYLGMAAIGLVLVFIFTLINVVKKIFDLDDKVKQSYGQMFRSLLRSILVIVSMNLVMLVSVSFTNALMFSVKEAFDGAYRRSTEKPPIVYTNEQFAAMGRIMNTIGNYSLNPSYKSRYNINACYNAIRTDLKYLGDTHVFDYYYVNVDEKGRPDNNWQYSLQQIAQAGNYNVEYPVDKYDEALSIAITNCMDLLKTDSKFHALREYDKYTAFDTYNDVKLDTLVFLAATMGMGDTAAARTEEYNKSPDLYDNLRGPYFIGEKSIYNLKSVNLDFDISVSRTNYLIAYFTALALIVNLATIILNCIVRLFNLMFMYLIAPPVAATIPLDDGAKFKQWTTAFIVQLFAVFGSVIAMRLFLIYVPIIMSPALQLSDTPALNIIGKLVMVWAGTKAVEKGNSILTGILSDTAGMQSAAASDMSRDLRGSAVGRMASGARAWAERKGLSIAGKAGGTAFDIASLPARPITGALSALGGKISGAWNTAKGYVGTSLVGAAKYAASDGKSYGSIMKELNEKPEARKKREKREQADYLSDSIAGKLKGAFDSNSQNPDQNPSQTPSQNPNRSTGNSSSQPSGNQNRPIPSMRTPSGTYQGVGSSRDGAAGSQPQNQTGPVMQAPASIRSQVMQSLNQNGGEAGEQPQNQTGPVMQAPAGIRSQVMQSLNQNGGEAGEQPQNRPTPIMQAPAGIRSQVIRSLNQDGGEAGEQPPVQDEARQRNNEGNAQQLPRNVQQGTANAARRSVMQERQNQAPSKGGQGSRNVGTQIVSGADSASLPGKGGGTANQKEQKRPGNGTGSNQKLSRRTYENLFGKDPEPNAQSAKNADAQKLPGKSTGVSGHQGDQNVQSGRKANDPKLPGGGAGVPGRQADPNAQTGRKANEPKLPGNGGGVAPQQSASNMRQSRNAADRVQQPSQNPGDGKEAQKPSERREQQQLQNPSGSGRQELLPQGSRESERLPEKEGGLGARQPSQKAGDPAKQPVREQNGNGIGSKPNANNAGRAGRGNEAVRRENAPTGERGKGNSQQLPVQNAGVATPKKEGQQSAAHKENEKKPNKTMSRKQYEHIFGPDPENKGRDDHNVRPGEADGRGQREPVPERGSGVKENEAQPKVEEPPRVPDPPVGGEHQSVQNDAADTGRAKPIQPPPQQPQPQGKRSASGSQQLAQNQSMVQELLGALDQNKGDENLPRDSRKRP